MRENPHCDICGRGGLLQLHHIKLIRHGYQTTADGVRLLCPLCHCELHDEFDMLLDDLHDENSERNDWQEIYDKIKTKMRTDKGLP